MLDVACPREYAFRRLRAAEGWCAAKPLVGVGGVRCSLLEGWAGAKAKGFRNRDSNPGLSGESRLS